MKTQQTLKLAALAIMAAIVTSCSTESKFARHIHNSDMVRADKHPVVLVKKENNQKFHASIQKVNSIKNSEVENLGISAQILTKEEVLKINNQNFVELNTLKNVDFSKSNSTKSTFIQKIKTIKKINHLVKENKLSGGGDRQIIEVILCFFIPPLAVFLHSGLGTEFWISLILTILGFLPGVIYSLLVVLDII